MRRGARAPVARSRVLWCLASFAVLQGGLWLVVDGWRPDLRDPEYGTKRRLLHEQLAQKPGQPLALVLGSSRVANGLRPDRLPPLTTSAGEAVVFNFGITGASPLKQLLNLRRLLADGCRPRWVVIEVVPALLPLNQTAEELVQLQRQNWADVRTLWRYCAHPRKQVIDWLKLRVNPWYLYRFCLLSQYLNTWVPDQNQVRIWEVLDAGGWMPNPHKNTPKARARHLKEAWFHHALPLSDFRIAEVPDRALREMLSVCRQAQIPTALLLMPEGRGFQKLYSPAAHTQLAAYVQDLSRSYEAPVIDARSWIADELFSDSHHLLPEGATRFTERFGREGLVPFMEGRLLPVGSSPLAVRRTP